MAINNTEIDELNIVEEAFAIGNAVENANKDAHEPKKIYDSKKTYQKHIYHKIWLEYKTGTRTVDGLEGKLTDKAVDAATNADTEYLQACKETNDAYHEYLVADDWANAMSSKQKGLELVTKYVLGGWFSGLKIADVNSIQNFSNGSETKGNSAVEERQALREERKRRRAKEETEEIV